MGFWGDIKAGGRNNKGLECLSKGLYVEAVAEFTEAIRLSDDADYRGNRACAYAGIGEYGNAIADADNAIKMKPKESKFYVSKGWVYLCMGDLVQASKYFAHAILFLIKNTSYFDIGVLYGLKGYYEEAIANFNSAIKLKPDVAGFYHVRAGAYYSNGDFDLAIADYSEAIRIGPTAGSFSGRAEAYYCKGDSSWAIADISESLRLDPDAGNTGPKRKFLNLVQNRETREKISDAMFCMKCGTKASEPVPEPLKRVCVKCKNEIADGFLFCNKCGHKLGLAGKLRIKCVPHVRYCWYKVIVDGHSFGSDGVGGTVAADAVSDTWTVEIISSDDWMCRKINLINLMTVASLYRPVVRTLKLTLRPRPGGNPEVDFKVDFTGYPLATVHDADILRQERC
jgi:tetratricopeptide (TPR) repeat protein